MKPDLQKIYDSYTYLDDDNTIGEITVEAFVKDVLDFVFNNIRYTGSKNGQKWVDLESIRKNKEKLVGENNDT